jgi:DNA-binding NarL/FixJ family response regulator
VTGDGLLLVRAVAGDPGQVGLALSRSWPRLSVHEVTGTEAVVTWLRDRPDNRPGLLLFDLDADPDGGRAALAAVRRVVADLPVLVLSERTDPAEVDAWYRAGADAWLFRSDDFALLQTTLATGLQYWVGRDRPR